MKKWKLVNSRKILKNKWLTVEENDYQRADGKLVENYYKISRNDYVVILAIDNQQNLIMEHQYRIGADKIFLELPAGFVESGETYEQAALRELQEETGFIGKTTRYLGSFYPSAGFLTMRGHIVYIEVDGRKDTRNLDSNEEIEVVKIPLEKAHKLVREQKILDVSAMVAIELYKDLNNN